MREKADDHDLSGGQDPEPQKHGLHRVAFAKGRFVVRLNGFALLSFKTLFSRPLTATRNNGNPISPLETAKAPVMQAPLTTRNPPTRMVPNLLRGAVTWGVAYSSIVLVPRAYNG
jgi:hypothetical protein